MRNCVARPLWRHLLRPLSLCVFPPLLPAKGTKSQRRRLFMNGRVSAKQKLSNLPQRLSFTTRCRCFWKLGRKICTFKYNSPLSPSNAVATQLVSNHSLVYDALSLPQNTQWNIPKCLIKVFNFMRKKKTHIGDIFVPVDPFKSYFLRFEIYF